MEAYQKKKAIYLTAAQALAKAEAYCAYQERSQGEVRGKLWSWGIHGHEAEELIATLVEHNFLNEERFAKAYAAGKFRMKGWGKHKIKQGLTQKSVSEPLIKSALASISQKEYLSKISEILDKKASSIPDTDPYKRKYKLSQYLISRGFESEIIFELLNDNDL